MCVFVPFFIIPGIPAITGPVEGVTFFFNLYFQVLYLLKKNSSTDNLLFVGSIKRYIFLLFSLASISIYLYISSLRSFFLPVLMTTSWKMLASLVYYLIYLVFIRFLRFLYSIIFAYFSKNKMSYLIVPSRYWCKDCDSNSLQLYSYGPPHMSVRRQDDQHEHTFSSDVRIRDVVLNTCLGR